MKMFINKYIFYFVLFVFLHATNGYKYKIKYFDTPLDHFSYAKNKTFQLRYLVNDSYAFGNDSPILFYTGNEGDIELFAENTGFMWEMAPKLNAILVFAEHRYYGQSLPFGNASFDSPSHLGYLTSEQALADYAFLLSYLNPSSKKPVIAIGGSYGGMLSAWFRMKYPHIITGALASSAPILQFGDIVPCNIFNRIVTSVFATAYTKDCVTNIQRAWTVLKNLAATEDGRRSLKSKFNFCQNFTKAEDLEEFFDYLTDVYGNLAMANYPYSANFLAPLPAYPVREFCGRLSVKLNDTKLIQQLQSAINIYSNFTGKISCLDISTAYDSTLGSKGWDFQACSEMVMPTCSKESDMFISEDWDLKKYSDKCDKKFNVKPNPNSAVTFYGGTKINTATNIIFSNGLLDPWSGGGVLRTPNDKIYVIIIPEGAHHIDLRAANINDPYSVLEARKQEQKIIEGWISNFYKINYY